MHQIQQRKYPVCLVYYTDYDQYVIALFGLKDATTKRTKNTKKRMRVIHLEFNDALGKKFFSEEEAVAYIGKMPAYIFLNFVYVKDSSDNSFPEIKFPFFNLF